MNKKALAELLRVEAEHAETHQNAPEKPGTIATRPGGQRTRVFSVRLSESESVALDAAAEQAGVTTSALVRQWIGDKLAGETSATDPHTMAVTLRSVAHRLETLDAV